jgi:hypothetical protein
MVPGPSYPTPSPKYNPAQTFLSPNQNHTGPTPYRTTAWTSSSPFTTPYQHDHNLNSHETDDGMDLELPNGMEDGEVEVELEDEITSGYEEANRLLRELEVVRRQRWGDR